LAATNHSPAFKLFHNAILERQQVTLTYNGQHREVCPYILGHKNGKETVLVFQFAGSSTDGGAVRGQWRCFYLSDVERPQARDGTWYGDAAHRSTQSCVDDVYIDVNTEVPNQPGRRFRIVK
jgi:predicted DNA-binding transcriptional regulator YafY